VDFRPFNHGRRRHGWPVKNKNVIVQQDIFSSWVSVYKIIAVNYMHDELLGKYGGADIVIQTNDMYYFFR
jgi:hypothetical protein